MSRPRLHERIEVVCKRCSNVFETSADRIAQGKGKYCSFECYKRPLKPCEYCMTPTNKTYCSKVCYDNNRRGKPRLNYRDDKHPNWVGERVSYQALHTWVRARLGKPNECTRCGDTTAKQFEWANLSHEYKRDLSDWVRLCQSCHRLYDNGKVKLTMNKTNLKVRG